MGTCVLACCFSFSSWSSPSLSDVWLEGGLTCSSNIPSSSWQQAVPVLPSTRSHYGLQHWVVPFSPCYQFLVGNMIGFSSPTKGFCIAKYPTQPSPCLLTPW